MDHSRLRCVFCPLCKAEFRQGFATCSDCKIALVATQEEANAAAVGRLWTGDDRKRMGKILDGLTSAGVPFHSREALASKSWPWFSIFLSIFLFRFMKPRPTFEFHIEVFQKDMAKAEDVIRDIEESEKIDDDED